MTPYFAEHGIRIFLGDNRNVMHWLAQQGELFDLCVTDTPFTAHTHENIRHGVLKSDSQIRKGTGKATSKPKVLRFAPYSREDMRESLGLVSQLGVRWVVAKMDIAWGGFVQEFPPRGLKFVRHGAWFKPNGVPQMSGDRPAQGYEYIAILHRVDHRGRMRWNGGGYPATWTHNVVEKASYETESPVPLYADWLRDFATPGCNVIDPHLGSGTSMVAAVQRGHGGVGIDISEHACEIAAKRVLEAQRQGNLFLPTGRRGAEKPAPQVSMFEPKEP